MIARHKRYSGLFHNGFGSGFRAHRFNCRRRWSDKNDPLVGAGSSERRIFRQESIARVNRIGVGLVRGFENSLAQQVRVPGCRAANMNRLIRELHVQCIAVGVRVHRDSGYPEFPGGAYDPAGNLAAIGNQ